MLSDSVRHAASLRTLTEALDFAASTETGIGLIHGRSDEETLSYTVLRDEALAMLGRLQARGVGPGTQLVLQVDDIRLFLTVLWACLYGGIIVAPVPAGSSEEVRQRLAAVRRVLTHPYLVTAQSVAEGDGPISDPSRVDAAWPSSHLLFQDDLTQSAPTAERPIISENAIACVQFSSGSTGEPKGVTLTHGNLLSNVRAILSGARLTRSDSALSWMPLTHDMGLIGSHLTAVVGAGRLFLMPPSLFATQPMLWLHKASQHRVSILSAPNFGYRHFFSRFQAGAAADWDLSNIRLIFNGAEPISAALCAEFVRTLAPYGLAQHAIFPVYGMAEASLAVTFPSPGAPLTVHRIARDHLSVGDRVEVVAVDQERPYLDLVEVGRPVDECAVRIRGDGGRIEDDGVIGHIEITGRNVTAGYFNNEAATAAAFTADGWLRTGDLGFLREGRLVVTGRQKDIIFVRGRNYYPHDIEAAALQVDGIGPGKIAVCGIPDPRTGTETIAAFVQYRGALSRFAQMALALRRVISTAFGFDLPYVVPVARLPRTTSGKVQRYKLADAFAAGEYDDRLRSVAELLTEQATGGEREQPAGVLEERVADLWRAVLGTETIGRSQTFFAAGGDSLKAATLASQIAETFGVDIPLDRLFELSTIAKQAEYLAAAPLTPYQPIPVAAERPHYPSPPHRSASPCRFWAATSAPPTTCRI